MTYHAPDGRVYPSRYRYERRGSTCLHVFDCLSCGVQLDDPEANMYRRSGTEYCDSACRSKAWRAAKAAS